MQMQAEKPHEFSLIFNKINRRRMICCVGKMDHCPEANKVSIIFMSEIRTTARFFMFEILVPLVILFVIMTLVFLRRQKDQPFSERQTHFQNACKTKAQSEDIVKGQIQYFPKVRVQYIIDGDTVIVAKGWREIRIRLDSIDCPEDGQYWGDIARYGLIKLIGGRRTAYLEEHGIDGYGRTLATIYIWHAQKEEWLNVNERMVLLGHAWVMRRFYDHLPKDRQDKLNRLERWARSKKIGLWHAPNPIPPWEWRKEGLCSPGRLG